MKTLPKTLCLLALLTLAAACGNDDEDYLPPYRQELCEAQTDAAGIVAYVRFDDGTERLPANVYSCGLRDTLFRAYAVFEPSADGVRLLHVSPVLAVTPVAAGSVVLRSDPLQCRAAWRGGRYLNLLLTLQSGSNAARHVLGVVDEGVTAAPSGARVLSLRLYHDQNGDTRYYSRDTYLSCRLDAYAGLLTAGDSIALRVTEAGGERTLQLAY
ncbi:MAG: hypothetical protein IJ722_04720 [Alloprevotella sp.]|nr:hypothetical protein [Alloprevotella sp.]